MPRTIALVLMMIGGLSLGPQELLAQFTLLERETATLELGGYVRSLTQLYDPGYDIPGQDTRKTGTHAEVARLKWRLELGGSVLLEIHNRLQVQMSSSEAGVGDSPLGFGVSVTPGRRWDLSTSMVNQDRLQAWHDVDRLSLTWFTDLADVTAGRQAITWGLSSLYPVADLWAQFSPFELDTEEKPGVDGVRILHYPNSRLEIDVVAADRGSSRNFSAGVRGSLTLPWADVYLAGGKFWRESMGMAGISAPMGSYKLRGEVLLPYNLDEEGFKLPRVTVGLDWLGGETVLSAEYNFNGIGATDSREYGEVLQDPRFGRGETYFLGRHNLGGMAVWTPGNDRLSLSATGLLNLQDPSAALVPNLTYDFGQETRVSIGGLVSFGETPLFSPGPNLRSEFGTYGDFMFAMVSVYF